MERHKLAAFIVRFIDEQQPAGGVVSQSHNEMPQISLDTGQLIQQT